MQLGRNLSNRKRYEKIVATGKLRTRVTENVSSNLCSTGYGQGAGLGEGRGTLLGCNRANYRLYNQKIITGRAIEQFIKHGLTGFFIVV